jgi:hypothetical protein
MVKLNYEVCLFHFGYTPQEIAQRMEVSTNTVYQKLRSEMTELQYKEILKRNKKDRKMNDTVTIDNNRQIISVIAEKIRENKIKELSDEDLMYAKILFQNGFMDSKGQVTKEGREALYN